MTEMEEIDDGKERRPVATTGGDQRGVGEGYDAGVGG